jgi:PAS domain S-box-containing protein
MNDVNEAEILVVDDNRNNLKLLDEILSGAGYHVRLANDGELALRSAMVQPPALVLLDIRMPGMDGFEVCRRLKADERTRDVPIIFVSIVEDEHDKVLAFQAGAVDYITKPFQPEEVLARIHTHLKLRELTEGLERMVVERTAALQASETKYRGIVETANEGIWLLGPDDCTTFVNPRLTEMFGYSVDEMLNRPGTDFLFEEDKADFQKRMATRRNTGKSEIYECRYRHKDGRSIWTQVSETPLFGETQKVVGTLNMFIDLSEHKATERLAQARLRILEKTYSAGLRLDETLQRMLDEIEAITGSSIGFYHFMDTDQQTLSLQIWSTNTIMTMCMTEGNGRHYALDKAGIWADCVRKERPVIHNDYASLPNRRGMPEGHAQVIRELSVPIRRGDKIVAIIGVGNKPEAYTETDVQNVLALGDFSWEIVIRKLAEEKLEKLNQELEQRVLERTEELKAKNEELERTNQLFVGRELKMVELKKKIKELEHDS